MSALAGGNGTPPGAGPGKSPMPGPGAGPMMTPQKPGGMQEGAKVDCQLAMKKLEQALSVFGSTSEEGKAILTAIKSLAKAFGKSEDETKELMPAEIKQMLMGLGGPGAPPPGMGTKPPGPPGMPPGGAPSMMGAPPA